MNLLSLVNYRGALAAIWLVAACLCMPHAAVAQVDGTASLRGAVFDSTSMEPLAGARVAVIGTSAVGETDEQGPRLVPL